MTDLQPAPHGGLGAPARLGKPHTAEPQDRVALPRPAFLHAALVVGLLVVELVVTGVPAPGGGRNHGPGLPRRVVTWACEGKDGHKGDKGGVSATGPGLGQSGTPRHLSHVLWGVSLPSQRCKPFPGPQELR